MFFQDRLETRMNTKHSSDDGIAVGIFEVSMSQTQ